MSLCVPEGKIDLDSEAGRLLGFTSDKFGGWLWRDGDDLWISFITSHYQGQGHFRSLLAAIQGAGFTVIVPTPSGRMREILARLGFVSSYRTVNVDGMPEEVEVMTR